MDAFAWLRGELIGEDALIETPFGTRRVTYADHIASGRGLRWVEESLARVWPLYANTHTEDSATGARTTALTHEASHYIKSQLGADESCKLLFCGSGATGAVRRLQDILGLTVPEAHRARVLASLPPQERPVVFVGPYEHHSNEVSWRETLAEVVEIPLCPLGGIDLEALRLALKDPRYAGRPRIGSFSAASNVTGTLSDTRSIARLLHAQGAYAFFDFAACAPYTPIDMKPGRPDGYDAIFLSAHKLAGGPGAPGLLCFQRHLYHLAAPSAPGGGTVTYVSATRHAFVDDIEAREDAGTPAIFGKLRAALAFKVKERLGAARIMEREHDLISRAIARLRVNPRVQLLGNLDTPRLAVLSFLIRTPDGHTLHPRLVVRLLNDLFGIQARGGCACAGPYGHALLSIDDATSEGYFQCITAHYEGVKPGWTRLNLAPWLADETAEFLLSAIEFVAEHGHKFVPLYRLDWHSGTWTHPADEAQPSLFDLPGAEVEGGPVPYAAYLCEAEALAEGLSEPAARELPPEVPRELVYFSY